MNWRKRFREQRLAALHDQLKSERPRTHSEEDIAVLLNATLTRRPKRATHWSMHELADETGISKVPRSAIWRCSESSPIE
jgi:putative transposase